MQVLTGLVEKSGIGPEYPACKARVITIIRFPQMCPVPDCCNVIPMVYGAEPIEHLGVAVAITCRYVHIIYLSTAGMCSEANPV